MELSRWESVRVVSLAGMLGDADLKMEEHWLPQGITTPLQLIPLPRTMYAGEGGCPLPLPV